MKAIYIRVFFEKILISESAKCMIRFLPNWGVWWLRDFLTIECICFIERLVLTVRKMFECD